MTPVDARRGRLRALWALAGALWIAAVLRALPPAAPPSVPAPPCPAPGGTRADAQATVVARCDGALPEAGGATRLLLGVPLDVNRATDRDLAALPGIGPRLARRIVEHRMEHGPFASVDALRDVRGIGPHLLARVRGLVTAAPPGG
ncbi:MAG: helix-hairpin-helix domain-containing protein [Deltaproteobacteria bacterium]|nr:helix-hairpin-helix domain-containing protein [Deltaproteobacteria bacterium]